MSMKILVTYHKPAELIKSEVLIPIHAGRALQGEKKWMLDMQGDDTGENISSKNDIYCELTAMYWAWKNYNLLGNPEYIGMMHYRRHLNFNTERNYREEAYGIVTYDLIDDKYKSDICLNDNAICMAVNGFDIVIGKRWDVSRGGHSSVYNQYKESHGLNSADYDAALNVLKEQEPAYAVSADKYNSSVLGVFTNIFIMKRELFFEYCEWLFGILSETEKRINVAPRVLGHISERLMGIFIIKKGEEGKRIRELQRTFISHTDIDKIYIPPNRLYKAAKRLVKYLVIRMFRFFGIEIYARKVWNFIKNKRVAFKNRI